MKEFKYVIKDTLGMHARPAGIFVKAASAYPCSITLELNGKSADAKRILNVMALCAKCGNEITLRADGEMEEEAIEGLKKVLEENL